MLVDSRTVDDPGDGDELLAGVASGRGLTPVTSNWPCTQSLPTPRRRLIQGAARIANAPSNTSTIGEFPHTIMVGLQP